MSQWSDSNWVDYPATILNVFAGGGNAWIEFKYTIWYVGWRQIIADTPDDISHILSIAISAKETGTNVMLRVSGGNPAHITAIQTE